MCEEVGLLVQLEPGQGFPTAANKSSVTVFF